MKKTILIVDDSTYVRAMVACALMDNQKYEVIGMASSGYAAINDAVETVPDIILLDDTLPDLEATEVIEILKEEEIDSDIYMMSDFTTMAEIPSENEITYRSIVKPFTERQFLDFMR